MKEKINFEACKEIEQQYSTLKDYWYGLNSTTNMGTMTYLYKKYGCPATYQQFYDSYVSDITGKDPKTYGRSEEYLMKQAQILSNRVNNEVSVEKCFEYIIKKLIIDTLDGSQKELQIKDYLISKGYSVKEPNYYQDTTEGIDKFVYKGDKLACIIQIKPNTFFIGNNNWSLCNDRIRAIKKEQICLNKYKVPVYYFIYRKTEGTWIYNEKKKLGHKLTDLIDKYGLTKQPYAYFK